MTELISVIIPSWNGRALLEACLASLQRQTRKPDEIIVVDNGSTDGTGPWLAQHHPRVQRVLLSKNFGFAYAVNRGIERAKNDLLVLLNNDAVADAGWLAALEQGARRHPDAQAFSSRLVHADRVGVLQSAGTGLEFDTFEPYNLGNGDKEGPPWAVDREIFGPCAGAALYRRTFFDAVGLFDETFVSYYEDVDLNFRARLLGMKSVYVAQARVTHVWQATSRRLGVRKDFYKYRNRALVWLKNLPQSFIRKHGWGLWRAERRWFLHYAMSLAFFVPFWAWADIFLRRSQWRQKRRDIHTRRTVSDDVLRSSLSLPQ